MIPHDFDPPPAWRDWLAERKWQVFTAIDAMRGYPALRRRYEAAAGYPLDLANPVTVGDKVTWRKIHDRNPAFPVLADKARLREYARTRLGEAADALFPRLYAVVSRARDLDFDAMPADLILKCNHASGWNIVLRAGEPVDHDRVRRMCAHWLRRTYAPENHEWAYSRMPRRVVAEELLSTPDGGPPQDVKLHMYDGVCRRFSLEDLRGPRLAAFHYTPDWLPYDAANTSLARNGMLAPLRNPPERIADMLRTAEALSAGHDYLRVDFLDLGPRFTLTELTLYPAGGYGSADRARDVEIAKHWRNPRWPGNPAPSAPE